MHNSKYYRDRAWSALSGNWCAPAGAYALYLLIYIVGVLCFIPGEIVSILLIPVTWGFTVEFLELVRGRKFRIGSAFTRGYRDFARVFGTMLLVTIYTCLYALLLIIPGLIMYYAYAMTPYILHDHPELRFNAAISRSVAMMTGHKWELCKLHLSFLGWFLLGCCTFGVGLIWFRAYIDAAQAQFYEDLKTECAEPQA